MQNCDHYFELLSAQIDGMLTEEEERELLAHVLVCEDCKALQEDLLELSDTMSEMQVIVPEGLSANVMAAVQKEKRGKIIPFYRRKNFIGSMLTAAAMLALIAVTGTGLSQLLDNNSTSPDVAMFAAPSASPSGDAAQTEPRMSATFEGEPTMDQAPAEVPPEESAKVSDLPPDIGGDRFIEPTLPPVTESFEPPVEMPAMVDEPAMPVDLPNDDLPLSNGVPELPESDETLPEDEVGEDFPVEVPADTGEVEPAGGADIMPLMVELPSYVGEMTFRLPEGELPDFLAELGVPLAEEELETYRLEVSADEYRAIELQFIAGEYAYESITEGEGITPDGEMGIIWILYH